MSCVAEAMRRTGKDLTREKFIGALEVSATMICDNRADHLYFNRSQGMKYNNVFRYDKQGGGFFYQAHLKPLQNVVAPASKDFGRIR